MKKVLIVEDDPAIRKMYVFKLAKENYTVIEAENGLIGLQKAETEAPHLILADLRMPVMDGTEMIRRIRAEHWGGRVKIIVLTNISRTEAGLDLQLLRIHSYIVKAHFTPSQVMQEIHEAFRYIS